MEGEERHKGISLHIVEGSKVFWGLINTIKCNITFSELRLDFALCKKSLLSGFAVSIPICVPAMFS